MSGILIPLYLLMISVITLDFSGNRLPYRFVTSPIFLSEFSQTLTSALLSDLCMLQRR